MAKALGAAAGPALPRAHLRRTRSTPSWSSRCRSTSPSRRDPPPAAGRTSRSRWRWPTRWTPRCWTTRACCCSATSAPRVATGLHHRRRDQQRLRPRGQRGRAARGRDGGHGPRHASPTSWRSRKDLLDTDDEAPIIRLVNSLLFRAAKERASDIHIEPMERELLVRFRIDGVLQEIIKPPKRYQNSHRQPREDHGAAEHRREAPAAGRPHPHQARRPRHRHPRLDHPHHVRRAHRDASARQDRHAARPRPRSAWRGTRSTGMDARHQALARHHPGHRPHRLRQDDHALRRALAASTRPTSTSSPSRIRSSTSSRASARWPSTRRSA